VTTQDPKLRALIDIDESAKRLERFLKSSVELMKIIARSCGHDHLNKFRKDELTSWKKEIADLCGIKFAGLIK
jgi:glutamate synthase domain-containing protein 2